MTSDIPGGNNPFHPQPNGVNGVSESGVHIPKENPQEKEIHFLPG